MRKEARGVVIRVEGEGGMRRRRRGGDAQEGGEEGGGISGRDVCLRSRPGTSAFVSCLVRLEQPTTGFFWALSISCRPAPAVFGFCAVAQREPSTSSSTSTLHFHQKSKFSIGGQRRTFVSFHVGTCSRWQCGELRLRNLRLVKPKRRIETRGMQGAMRCQRQRRC